MKISIYGEKDINRLDPESTEVILVRPLNFLLANKLFKRCRLLKKITLCKSCYKRIPKRTLDLINKRNIELAIRSSAGRAIAIDLKRLLDIIELRKDFRTFREIEKITKIPKSTAHYLIKYAKREKIKDGNNVFFLR